VIKMWGRREKEKEETEKRKWVEGEGPGEDGSRYEGPPSRRRAGELVKKR